MNSYDQHAAETDSVVEICSWLSPFHKQTASLFFSANQGDSQEHISSAMNTIILIMVALCNRADHNIFIL